MKTKILSMPWRAYWGFVSFLFRRFEEIRVLQVAGSLTFTTLLALVPVLTVMLVLVTAFPLFDDVSGDFMQFVNDMIVPSGASVISAYLDEFRNQASKLTAVGICMMLITSLLLIQTIDQTFNRIWRVKRPRSPWLQFPIYWALLTFTPVVVGVSSSMAGQLGHILPWFSGEFKLLWMLIFDTFAMYVLYRIVPNRYVPIYHALIGAFITALWLELAKWGFGIYIRNFNSYQLIYGAFAVIPVFLVWLHVLWTIVLTGAVFTASLSYWRGGAYLRPKGQRALFNDIVQILLMLRQAQYEGKALRVQDFRPYVNMGYDELGDLLDKLEECGYIGSHKNAWLLKKAVEQITLSELVARFIYTPSAIDNNIKFGLETLMQPSFEVLEISLDEFERRFVRGIFETR